MLDTPMKLWINGSADQVHAFGCLATLRSGTDRSLERSAGP
jgi:hypothetical protein